MIYFLITTSLKKEDYDLRQKQYTAGITTLLGTIKDFTNHKVIIIENNGKRQTFLDNFGCDVFYTENNKINTSNIGIKELADINDCIKEYNIADDDFIIKMTGRYILNKTSEFIEKAKELNNNNKDIHCIIRYGNFMIAPVNYQMEDCLTGLIGMLCKYIKLIKPYDSGCVEHYYAKITYLINDSNICILNTLGISMCPGTNNYFNI